MTEPKQEPTQDAPTTPDPKQQTDTEPQSKTGDNTGFSQEDVNRFTSKARQDGRKSVEKDMLAKYGVDNMADIDKMFADAKARKEADMSESDKSKLALETMTAERDAANTKLAEQSATQLQGKRDSAIRKAMLAGGAKDKEVDDLLILVDSKMASDKSNLFGDGKSEVETTKMDAFVKQVQSQMGSYFGTAGAGSPAILGKNPPATNDLNTSINEYTKRMRGR